MLIPTEIKMHRKSRVLELVYADGQRYDLAAEYLRKAAGTDLVEEE